MKSEITIKGTDYCNNCMRRTGGQETCPYCGFRQGERDTPARYLPAGTVLTDRYVLGRVLGQGSFGITYIGRDVLLDSIIAVKEYFPKHHVHRNVMGDEGHRVCLYEEEDPAEYELMMGKFLDEAKRLTQFREVEGIVSVQDFFYENNTAYMVMDYIEGVSLKEYIEEKGVREGAWVLEHMDPLLNVLEQIHETGLIHRDISPDNIIVRSDSRFVLIDFGSAREANADRDKSLTVVFKRGFSPLEQYRSRGEQGIWSDVYAICATIYFCLTGIVPDEALERVFMDEVPSLLAMPEVALSRRQKKAVMKGISVQAQERYKDIRGLRMALSGEKEKSSRMGKILCAAGAAVILCVILYGVRAGLKGSRGQTISLSEEGSGDSYGISPPASFADVPSAAVSTPAVQERQYHVPFVVGMSYKKAKKKLESNHLKAEVKRVVSEKEKGTVLSQSMKKGRRVKAGERIVLKVSKGKPKPTATPVPTDTPRPSNPTHKPRKTQTKKPSTQNLDGMID